MSILVNKRGASLIEIIVVVAILLVLLAILLPYLGSIQDRRERLVCGNNLRNLHSAVFTYAVDHQGWFPAGIGGQYNMLRDLADGGYLEHNYAYINNADMAKERMPAYLYCPNYPEKDVSWWRMSYAFNRYIFGNFSTSEYDRITINDVRPENWIFTETFPGNSNFAVIGNRMSLGWRFRHGDGSNVVNASGAVEFVQLDENLTIQREWIWPERTRARPKE